MGNNGTWDSEMLRGWGSSLLGTSWLERAQSPGSWGRRGDTKQKDCCGWQGRWPKGKLWG